METRGAGPEKRVLDDVNGRLVGGIAIVWDARPETVGTSDVIDLANAVASVFTVGFRRGRVWSVYWVYLYLFPVGDNEGSGFFRSNSGFDVCGVFGLGRSAHISLVYCPISPKYCGNVPRKSPVLGDVTDNLRSADATLGSDSVYVSVED